MRGRSVEDVIRMIRDAFRAPNRGDRNVPSGDAAPTRETAVEGASEVSSEPPPGDALSTDATAPGGWIIMGCGDEDGERGFVVEGTLRPSKPREGKP